MCKSIEKPLKELAEKHREVKMKLIDIISKVNRPTITKERIADDLFLLYQELK